MTPDLLDLAREVVTLPGWRWMPGMRGRCGDGSWVRVVAAPTTASGPPLWAHEYQQGDEGDATYRDTGAHVVVDLADPATLGCLLALVREAWGDPSIYALSRWHGNALAWRVGSRDEGSSRRLGVLADSPTEAAALVAALRAAGAL